MPNLQILRLQNNKLTLNAIPESLFGDSQVSVESPSPSRARSMLSEFATAIEE